jgi:hypothetical protein
MPVTINGSAGVTTNSGAVYNSIQSDTAKTASGTSVDFTGIPSWVKRITVMCNGVSISGASSVLIQIGSTTFTVTGYVSGSSLAFGTNTVLSASSTNGYVVHTGGAVNVLYFVMTITNITGNNWMSSISGTNAGGSLGGGGAVAIGGTLDRVRITTVNGTDTFDAGSINILYE